MLCPKIFSSETILETFKSEAIWKFQNTSGKLTMKELPKFNTSERQKCFSPLQNFEILKFENFLSREFQIVGFLSNSKKIKETSAIGRNKVTKAMR